MNVLAEVKVAKKKKKRSISKACILITTMKETFLRGNFFKTARQIKCDFYKKSQ